MTGITDQNGYLWQSYRYDAFGNATFGSPQYDNEYTFNAENYNPNIHSQYLRARYYDTVKGCFLTEDTYLGDIRNPLTLNRYSYCIGNPLFYRDPSGHFNVDYRANARVRRIIAEDLLSDMNDVERSRSHDGQLYESYKERVYFYDALNWTEEWDAMGYSEEEQRISYIVDYDFKSVKNKSYVKEALEAAKALKKAEGCEDILENIYDLQVSPQGMEMIAGFELSAGDAKRLGIGEFDENGELIGIYPHYVFKQDSAGNWISDRGITFGYGHWVSEETYNSKKDAKALVDKYAPGASLMPEVIPNNGRSYKVPDSSYMPIEEAKELLAADIEKFENAVNDFLFENNVKLNRNQFDALVSFTYQYGENWWGKEEKKMPEFISEGKGTYDEEEVRRVFALHDNKERRAKEAEVFINGYN